MKYKVIITKVYEKIIEIEAENACDAEDKVREMYKNNEILLTSDDFVEVEIERWEDD